MNVANPYAVSYPGYSELLTGSVDFTITGNERRKNRNRNVLEVLNSTGAYAGKVAAFTSWDVFPYILHCARNTVKINSEFQQISDKTLTQAEQGVNHVQSSVIGEEGATRYDELTYIACKEYLLKHQPSVVLLSFSGTDDAGHKKRYDNYLQEANDADRMIGELWRLVQSHPHYAGKTTFLITTDHGRGSNPKKWDNHGFFIKGSSETWYAVLGPHFAPQGEVRKKGQVYQKELHELMLQILARKNHPSGI